MENGLGWKMDWDGGKESDSEVKMWKTCGYGWNICRKNLKREKY